MPVPARPGPKPPGMPGRGGGPAGVNAPRRVISAIAAFLVAFTLACGAGAIPTATLTPEVPVDPRVLLRNSVTNMLQLQSAAFTLEHQKGTTALIPGYLEMRKVSGVVAIPDRFKLTVEAESLVPRSFVQIRVVVIEDQAYITDPGPGAGAESQLNPYP